MKVEKITVMSEVNGHPTQPIDVNETKVYDLTGKRSNEVAVGLNYCPQCAFKYPEPVSLETEGVTQKTCEACGSLNHYQRRTFEKAED